MANSPVQLLSQRLDDDLRGGQLLSQRLRCEAKRVGSEETGPAPETPPSKIRRAIASPVLGSDAQTTNPEAPTAGEVGSAESASSAATLHAAFAEVVCKCRKPVGKDGFRQPYIIPVVCRMAPEGTLELESYDADSI